MKILKWGLFFLILMTVIFPANAQDKIYSLSLKQHEIESAIKKSLKPFLTSKDYVVKVKLKGIQVSETTRVKAGGAALGSDKSLPGFEIEKSTFEPKISNLIGDLHWQIKKMTVDLIIHKQIPPSVDRFIRKTVPIVSELEITRGDKFNFVPILPQSIAMDDNSVEIGEVKPKLYYGSTIKEWIFYGVIGFLIIFTLILFWRLSKARVTMAALEEVIDDEQNFRQDREGDPVMEQKQESEERLKKQEKLLQDSLYRDENEKIFEEIITQLLGRKDWAEQLVVEYSLDKQGVEKISQLIAILGANTARKLFYEVLGEEKYLEIEKMSDGICLDPAAENTLLKEIRKVIYTKRLILPEPTHVDPFTFLKDLSNGQLKFLIKEEPIKIKAIVLSQLSGKNIAEILTRFPKEERGKIAVQLGNIEDLPLELVEKVAYSMAEKANSIPDDNTVGFDGVDRLIDVISESSSLVRNDIINNLRTSDRNLSKKVESRLFLFESIPVVPNGVLIAVVRKLPSEDVIAAIVGSSKVLQEKVIMCFPEKVRRTMVSSLKAQKISEETIKTKQKLIVKEIQKMAEDETVDLRKIQLTWEKARSKKASAKTA